MVQKVLLSGKLMRVPKDRRSKGKAERVKGGRHVEGRKRRGEERGKCQ